MIFDNMIEDKRPKIRKEIAVVFFGWSLGIIWSDYTITGGVDAMVFKQRLADERMYEAKTRYYRNKGIDRRKYALNWDK